MFPLITSISLLYRAIISLKSYFSKAPYLTKLIFLFILFLNLTASVSAILESK